MPLLRSSALAYFLPGVLVFFLAGCGQKNPCSVTGKVTYAGAPLATGTVAFQPVDRGAMAYSAIGSDGSYGLQTGAASGLLPGDYLVMVTSTKPPGPPTPKNPEPLPESLIPKRYTDPQTSGLKFTVRPGANVFDIPLDE